MNCLRCGQEFAPQSGKVYCSDGCRHRAKKARRRAKNTKKFICEQCGREFFRNPDKGHEYRFCSLGCAGAAIRKPEPVPVMKECIGCGKEFSTLRSFQKYCSVTCSTEKVCDTCFRSFTISTSERGKNRRYCSRACFPNPHAHPTGNIVYFLLAIGLQRVKVGFSGEFRNRLDAIRTQEADETQVLGTIPGDQSLEQGIHAELDMFGARCHHEWFDFRIPEVQQVVNRYLYPDSGDPTGTPTGGNGGEAPHVS